MGSQGESDQKYACRESKKDFNLLKNVQLDFLILKKIKLNIYILFSLED